MTLKCRELLVPTNMVTKKGSTIRRRFWWNNYSISAVWNESFLRKDKTFDVAVLSLTISGNGAIS